MAQKQTGLEALWASGVVGTATIAALHQASRHLLKDAPRMDVVGEKLIEKGFTRIGRKPPEQTKMLSWALGNVGTDTLVFAAVGFGAPKRPVVRGLIVGALSGAAALLLPPKLGISSNYAARTPKTALLTMGFYVAAGLAAGLALKLAPKIEDAIDD